MMDITRKPQQPKRKGKRAPPKKPGKFTKPKVG